MLSIVGLGGRDADDADLRLKKSLLVASSAMMALAAIGWGITYLLLGQHLAGAIPLTYAVLTFFSITLFARLARYRLFRASQLTLSLLLPFLLCLALGGLIASSGVVLWSLTCPLGALVFAGYREARWWFVAFLATLGAAYLLDPVVADRTALSERVIEIFIVLNIAGVSMVAFVLLQYFTIQREAAQDRSDALLLNILPAPIAERLKQNPTTIAEHYDSVTVLFADVVDFTPLSADLAPTELVELLNEVFTVFDGFADRFGAEKIKTIGDCYMAAAGVPDRRDGHALIATNLALAMRNHVETNDFGGRTLEFRIGINSGPAVAGVIGARKFIYDLWGDVVNTASRMESLGQRGTIQITRATYDLIQQDFVCEPRGTISVKGKGDMETWHVLGPR
ncbi:MAG: adenylate/guanylate cyclase domain-containing protein [Acidimicrobiia bacterium]|nr:adenylate/guanylate cyclase domain-containing protein [Acidimicrobiia bacterium]